MKNNHWDDRKKFYYQNILNKDSLNNVRKFHQLTTLTMDMRNVKGRVTNQLHEFLRESEWKTPLPKNYLCYVDLNSKSYAIQSSRDFDKTRFLCKSDLAYILGRAFAADKNLHRPFPSGGAMYAVYPVLIVLKVNKYSEEELLPGVYYYDGLDKGAYKLKSLSEKDTIDLKKSLFPFSADTPSNYCIAYIGDFEKEVFKYNELGYKHLLLETGMMAQSFRMSLKNWNLRSGDISFSGFKSNVLSGVLGFNKDIAPVLLIQWFGVNRNV